METGPPSNNNIVAAKPNIKEDKPAATIYFLFPIINCTICIILWIIILAGNFYGQNRYVRMDTDSEITYLINDERFWNKTEWHVSFGLFNMRDEERSYSYSETNSQMMLGAQIVFAILAFSCCIFLSLSLILEIREWSMRKEERGLNLMLFAALSCGFVFMTVVISVFNLEYIMNWEQDTWWNYESTYMGPSTWL